jgi:hypothetical protein
MITEKSHKLAAKYICDLCAYKCSKESDYTKHLTTRKHKNNYTELHINCEKSPKKYNCMCGKEYNYRQGLHTHKKKCNIHLKNHDITEDDENKIINSPEDVKMLTSLIMEVVKSNSDLQKQTLEMQQQILEVYKSSSVTNNNMNNCHNKTFNMQVFLNEKCKDAMNLTDFVNSMMLQFSDLEELGELGYVEGISRQMVRKLNEMDVYKRPIHCSDLKRETMYVRDNDVWEKETEIYDKLRKAIKYITKKNGDLMIPWRDAHPQCMKLEHPLNDVYLRIMNQAMGGKGEFAESESKIIRKISKCVTIDKKDM